MHPLRSFVVNEIAIDGTYVARLNCVDQVITAIAPTAGAVVYRMAIKSNAYPAEPWHPEPWEP